MFSANTPPADYIAALESATYYRIPIPGYVLITGETRREYLQRQTTNDLDLLTSDRVLPTLLTAPTGRILEYYTLLDNRDSIAMLTQAGHGAGNAAYFQKRVFFNDKVSIQDKSDEWEQIELLGPNAADLLSDFGFPQALDVDEVAMANRQDAELKAFGQIGFGSAYRFRLLIPSSLSDRLSMLLGGTPALSTAAREILRIESVQPGDPEFSAETTPFELGLDKLVSTTKGCYTGQEVLARQVTYDKVVRRMVQLRSDHPLTPNSAISKDGKTIGQITSVANSPRLGFIALGIVRKPHEVEGTELTVQDGCSEATGNITS
jgi:folate-binding protein YgfZ